MASSTAEEWKAQGNAALQEQRFDDAIEAYSKAIEMDSSNHVFFSNRSAAYLHKNDVEHALADAEQCIKLNPDWPKGYIRKGAALHTMDRLQDAIATYEEGLAKDPENAMLRSAKEEAERVAYANMGGQNPFLNLAAQVAAHPQYREYLNDPEFVTKLRMLEQNPQNLSAVLNDQQVMSVLMGLMGGMGTETRPTGAAAASGAGAGDSTSAQRKEPEPEPEPEAEPPREETEEEKAEREKKERAEAKKQEGNRHYTAKEFDDALRCYRAAREIDPDNVAILLNMAAVYIERDEVDDGIKLCEEAIQEGRRVRAPFAQIAKAYARIGNAHAKRKEYEKAIEMYETSLAESWSDAVNRKLKKTKDAKKKADEDAMYDPEAAEQAKLRGNEAFKAGDFPLAIEEYTEAIRRNPRNAVYYSNRAGALTKLMDFSKALVDAEQAIKLDPEYVKAYSRRGSLQFFMKDYHKALDSYRKGLELDPSNEDCKAGVDRTIQRINAQSTSGEVDEDRARRAMSDPEIQRIVRDPMVQQAIRDLEQGDSAGVMSDPQMMAKLQKLVAAGVLQVGGQPGGGGAASAGDDD